MSWKPRQFSLTSSTVCACGTGNCSIVIESTCLLNTWFLCSIVWPAPNSLFDERTRKPVPARFGNNLESTRQSSGKHADNESVQSLLGAIWHITRTSQPCHLRGCSTLLMFPQQGASQVRCSRCGHLTQAPQTPAENPDQSQIVCNGCRVLLSYPRGAQSVQCSLCHTVTQVPVYGHVQCGGCSIMLMYPLGAQSVKCSVCHFVTNVSQQANWAGTSSSPAAARQRPGSQQKNVQTVVVENPPTLDEQGNEVANIAVAVKDNGQ